MLIKKNNSCINDKKSYSFFFFFNFILKLYFKKLFNTESSILNKVVIKKRLNKFLIYIFIQKKKEFIVNKKKIDHNINLYLLENKCLIKPKIFITCINVKLFKKNSEFLPLFKIYKKQKKILNLFYMITLSIYSQNPQFLNFFLIKNLEKTKNHRLYMQILGNILKTQFLKYKNFLGYRIQLKGRVNGIKRARKIVLQAGQIPLNTIDSNIQFDRGDLLTKHGLCSVKTWFLFKKNVISKKN